MARMFCSSCGVHLSSTAAFCGSCGTAVGPKSAQVVHIAPARTAKERANDATEVIARVGGNFVLGWLAFKLALLVLIFVVLFLFAKPVVNLILGQ